MLGKDYMLAIILVNCDGVHGGARWEDQELREDEGIRKTSLGLKDRVGDTSLCRDQGANEPDLYM